MDWFMHHAVLIALVGAGVAVAYGLYLTWWLLQQPAGNDRMREISKAVQEGAAAYLKKQYTAIALVAIVPFLALGFYDKLGWGTAFGFLIGAVVNSPTSAINDLIGLAFGGSLISVFARLGGGIFTKAADVGADLV